MTEEDLYRAKQMRQEDMRLEILRGRYKAATGKDADKRWKAETIRKNINANS